MKKKLFTEDGTEVFEGQTYQFCTKTPKGSLSFTVKLDEESIPILIYLGILRVEDAITLKDCVNHLAKRIRWDKDNVEKYITNLFKIYPAASFSLLLRELAFIIDKRYDNHISESEEIYIINVLDGKITKLKDNIKIANFKNFAAFRTYEDAHEAAEVLKDFVSILYGEQKD